MRLCVPCGEFCCLTLIVRRHPERSRLSGEVRDLARTAPAAAVKENIATKARTTEEERPFKGRVRASNESGLQPRSRTPMKAVFPCETLCPCGELCCLTLIVRRHPERSRLSGEERDLARTAPAAAVKENIAAKARTTVEERPFKGRVRASNESGL